jgi:nucleoside-diphosphate-sugar epimerase
MKIVGHGLIAGSLRICADRHDGVVAFATGVADSTCTNEAAFARECTLLYETLADARSSALRVVYFSGAGALYGHWEKPASERSPVEPRSAYGRHQVLCEAIVAAAGVPFLIVRLPNVVGGSANPHQLVPSLVAQIVSGVVRVQKSALRDLVDAAALGPIIDELLSASPERDTVNLATGVSTNVTDIVAEICAILGESPAIVSQDGGEPQRFDTSHLLDVLGRDPFASGQGYRDVLRRHVAKLADDLAVPRQ